MCVSLAVICFAIDGGAADVLQGLCQHTPLRNEDVVLIDDDPAPCAGAEAAVLEVLERRNHDDDVPRDREPPEQRRSVSYRKPPDGGRDGGSHAHVDDAVQQAMAMQTWAVLQKMALSQSSRILVRQGDGHPGDGGAR